MMNEIFFEELLEDLNRSGIEFFFEVNHMGGETLIEFNEVSKKLFKEFKHEKKNKVISEKEEDFKNLVYEGNLYNLLLKWTGNKIITKYLYSNIKIFSYEKKYNIYTYVSRNIIKNSSYENILLEKAFDASVIIFESEKKIFTISVNWFC